MSFFLCKLQNTLNCMLVFILMTMYPISHHTLLSDGYVYVEVTGELPPVGITRPITGAIA